MAYCGIGCGNHSIISLEETLCRIGSIELSQYSLFVSNGAEETDRVYCFDVYFLYSTKKVDGDDEEKKTGDYLLIPGGVINCLDVFACTQSMLPLITLMLVLIQMLICMNLLKLMLTSGYLCHFEGQLQIQTFRCKCQHEGQRQSETPAERLLLWRWLRYRTILIIY